MASFSNPGHINMKQAQNLDISYLNEKLFDKIMYPPIKKCHKNK